MKVQRIDTLCNNCGNKIPDPGPQHEVPIIVEGHEYISDWCDTCRSRLMAKLAGDTTSLECGFNGCTFVGKTVGGLATHRARMNHQ